MVDTIDRPRSPLAGHITARRLGRRDGEAGVHARELAGRAMALVTARQGHQQALAEAVQQALGVPLPDAPRRVSGAGIVLQWHGARSWLAIMELMPPGGIEAHLATALGEHATIVDQSHATLQLRLSGARIRDALAKGVALDLHPRAFKPGDVAATTVAHVTLTLAMLDAEPSYEALTPRSSALSFWHWLEASSGEFGLEVAAAVPA